MHFLHPLPVDIPPLLQLLDPGQAWIGLDHGVDGLADGLLVDMLEVDLEALHRLDGDFALGDEFALAQGFVGGALAFGADPGQVALALFMAFLVQVHHRLEGDFAAAVQGQVGAGFQPGFLVALVALADQGEGAAGGDAAADVAHIGDFIAPEAVAAETALFLPLVQRVVAVFGRQQAEVVAGIEEGFFAGFDPAGHQGEVLGGLQVDVTPRHQ
ncbi:hypothetical protein D9M69_507730 [compost metagenome]